MFSSPLVGLVFLFLFIFKSVAGLHNVTIQENDPRIRYSDASWTHVLDLSDKPSLLGCSDGITQNTVEGSFFEFNFTGTAVYLNTIDGIEGAFRAILDDKPFDFNSGNATNAAHCRVAYSQTGLADGPHRLVILNARSPSSLLFDSITYTESDPYDYGNPPAGSIPHTNAPYVYVPVRPQSSRVTPSGSWQVVDLAPIGERIHYCADYVFQTATIGSYIEFRFNGTGVEVNTLADPHSRGFMTISIDGQNELVDGRGSSGDCKLAWNRKGLSPDVEHVLRVINAGPTVPDEASLISIASIKYSTTSDDPSVSDPNNNVPGLRPLPAYIPYEDLPTNPIVIGGAVAAGVFVILFLGFIFYWARRDRLKQAARKPDEEMAISSRKHKGENYKSKSAGGSMDDHRTPRQPRQAHVVVVPPPANDTPRSSITLGDFRSGSISSDSRPSTRQSGRKVGFLEPPNPSRS